MATPTLKPAAFAAPWRDLHERLNNAETTLHGLMRTSRGTDNEIRLTWKRDAITAALAAWERLNKRVISGNFDYPGAWRTYTDEIASLFGVADAHPGFYEGVAVALSYQRGYDPAIDAPYIRNPHLIKE